jgi:hypothetical protein
LDVNPSIDDIDTNAIMVKIIRMLLLRIVDQRYAQNGTYLKAKPPMLARAGSEGIEL